MYGCVMEKSWKANKPSKNSTDDAKRSTFLEDVQPDLLLPLYWTIRIGIPMASLPT